MAPLGRRGVVALCAAAALLAGCSALPALEGRSVSSALIETADTRLGEAMAPLLQANPGKSGIYTLANARDAFAARALLARRAERTLDVQYYIWRDDMTGTLLLDTLRSAADRGVRVRLLLDDNNTGELDAKLAALDAHPEVEVRLFNPFAIRTPRALGYVTDFSRLNRRMHNKSFTADNQVTIVGGRNVGDEYFGATEGVLFVDLDVMAVGPIVTDVSRDFDRYWASASAYPIHWLVGDRTRSEDIAAAGARAERSPEASAYVRALRESTFVQQLTSRTLPLEWVPARMVSDDPGKVLGRAHRETAVLDDLKTIIGDATSQVDLVSAYFVPSARGTAALVRLASRGVKIRILTNALEATDVPAVHAGYEKHRKALLEAGIVLYELKRLSPATRRGEGRGPMGSSGSSLHSKTFAVDGGRVFVGSYNFDPRSARLNTEMGFIIESPVLARRIHGAFDKRIEELAYEVRLTERGELYWLERADGRTTRHDAEPGTSFWRRSAVRFLSLLPIDWLL